MLCVCVLFATCGLWLTLMMIHHSGIRYDASLLKGGVLQLAMSLLQDYESKVELTDEQKTEAKLEKEMVRKGM